MIIHRKHITLLAFSVLILLSSIQLGVGQNSTSEDGYKIFTYPDGKISSEGYIKNGKPDGYWKSYFENGKIKSEGNRKDFELDSCWKFYNEDGTLFLV